MEHDIPNNITAKPYLLILLIAIPVLFAMVYSYHSNERMILNYAPLVDATMEVKLEATTGHLWLEEVMSGDRTNKIEDIIAHIDQSIWYANAMLVGGKNPEGTFFPLRSPLLRKEVVLAAKDLQSFKSLTMIRYETYESSGSGTEIDQQYDELFSSVISQIDNVESLLQQEIIAESHTYKTIQTVLIAFVVILTGFVFIVQLKYDRRHKENLAEIIRGKGRAEKSEALLRKTQQVAKVGGWEYDVVSKETSWTEEVYRIYEVLEDFNDGDIIDKSIEFYAPQDQAVITGAFQRAVEEGVPYDLELGFVSKSGKVKWVHTMGQVELVAGKTVRVFGHIVDITERKNSVDELERHRSQLETLVEEQTHKLKITHAELLQAERLATLGKVTATVSHELRNPLGTIQNSLFLFEDGLERNEPNQIGHSLMLAKRNIERCVNIIEELNSYARVRALNISEASVDDWVREVLEEQVMPDSILCEFDFSSGVRASFDKEKLRQVVVNLTTNAVHALQEKESNEKHLRISTHLLGDNYEIRFSDDGIGMSSTVREKVFEPMYSTKGFGVGVGMVIVKNIIGQHYGEINIESEEGAGTTITLRLPISLPEENKVS